MVNLLNLTVAAAAASVSILDHTQQFAFDLVSGGCRDYNSVQQFGRDNVAAQEVLHFCSSSLPMKPG